MPHRGYKQTAEHIEKKRNAQIGKKRGNARGWITGGRHWVMHNGKERRYACVVAEKMIGRPLAPNEVVHHINENTLDDSPENLQVMTRGDHTKLHKPRPHNNGGWMWTPEQRERYIQSFKKRPRPTEETKRQIRESMRRVRAGRFWTTKSITKQQS